MIVTMDGEINAPCPGTKPTSSFPPSNYESNNYRNAEADLGKQTLWGEGEGALAMCVVVCVG